MSKIILPKELYEKLELEQGQEIEVIDIARDSFTVKAVDANHHSDYAPRWFILPTVIATLIFSLLLYFIHQGHVLALTGNLSLSTAVSVGANAVAIITFTIAYFHKRKTFYRNMSPRSYWRTFLTVVVSVLIIMSLILLGLFWFLGQIFHGVKFDLVTSTIIFAVFSAILNYFMIFIVDSFSVNMMVTMLIGVSIGGLLSSMATSGNPYWWQRNFSELGTRASDSNLQFNLTLIVSAALMIALFDYIFVSLREKVGVKVRHIILQSTLTLCAASIALVGMIPNNGEGLAHVAHDLAAQAIVLFMSLSILGIRWFLPTMSENIYWISYGIVALIILSYLLWHPFHYFSLTAFEMLSFSLSFAWIMLLINNLLGMLWNTKQTYQVEIQSED
ncbi:AbrB/MazE/SpoVT family DNA-binding domain-containing protein [Lactococcus termiticola]|uniref:DUF998 domain-containing protein n=1 Tax=Lactococcus termiticola TaxID=2169526 RepID=A0A2R5HGF9_9LACT|nr:AbrB/MazE/SpoVT family DNA-binding domain-containing protein [Lactococcus termiticola]GBG97072.1 hypothetical protein NtB2_01209 [Lactococcus termiticola]